MYGDVTKTRVGRTDASKVGTVQHASQAQSLMKWLAIIDLIGNGFFVRRQKNVIIRNQRVSKVCAGIQASSRVWVDHCDLSSEQAHGKNYYGGLLHVTHASDYVTISNTHFHDHFKGSLVGHSDKMTKKTLAVLEFRSTTTCGQRFIAEPQAFDSELAHLQQLLW
jgi:pectate lyase